MNTNRLNLNVTIDYFYAFLKNFDLSSAIWVLYLSFKGMSLWQIGIIEGIFHITSFIFEIPSGALADLIGRKRVIIAGRIFSLVSYLVLLFSNSFLYLAIGFIFSALSYNLNSGSEEALVYDSMKLTGSTDNYLRVNSKITFIIELAQGFSTFLGGILAEYSFSCCYIAALAISILSLMLAFSFKEPLVNNGYEKVNILELFKNHFITCFRILTENKRLTKILIYFPTVYTFAAVSFFFGQQYFSLMGFNKIHISLIMLLNGFASSIGSISCGKAVELLGNRAKYIASVIMGIAILTFSIDNAVIAVITFCVIGYTNSILYPIQSASLNALIPSDQRATIISVDSMMFSMLMIIVFPACGLIGDIYNLHLVFGILGVLQLVLMFLIKNAI